MNQAASDGFNNQWYGQSSAQLLPVGNTGKFFSKNTQVSQAEHLEKIYAEVLEINQQSNGVLNHIILGASILVSELLSEQLFAELDLTVHKKVKQYKQKMSEYLQVKY